MPEISPADRLKLSGFGEERADALQRLTPLAEAALLAALDAMYDRVPSVPAARGVLRDDTSVAAARTEQLQRWLRLIAAPTGPEIQDQSHRVAAVAMPAD